MGCLSLSQVPTHGHEVHQLCSSPSGARPAHIEHLTCSTVCVSHVGTSAMKKCSERYKTERGHSAACRGRRWGTSEPLCPCREVAWLKCDKGVRMPHEERTDSALCSAFEQSHVLWCWSNVCCWHACLPNGCYYSERPQLVLEGPVTQTEKDQKLDQTVTGMDWTSSQVYLNSKIISYRSTSIIKTL
ncbi:hypothetical protein BC826DRAFT_973153 [Russula brevipes]|nr:hypothetical protein BC826DRAFT_973153 [Russula brevipes]